MALCGAGSCFALLERMRLLLVTCVCILCVGQWSAGCGAVTSRCSRVLAYIKLTNMLAAHLCSNILRVMLMSMILTRSPSCKALAKLEQRMMMLISVILMRSLSCKALAN